MSVVVARPPVAIYREEQWFAWWVYALVAGGFAVGATVVALVWSQMRQEMATADGWARLVPLAMFASVVVPPFVFFGLLKMTTEVTPGGLTIWFGILPAYRYAVPGPNIKSAKAVQYRPLLDCGGWGIRRSRSGHRVFTAKGNRAVEVELTDGHRLLIGSQRPDELAAMLDSTFRTGVPV